MEGDVNEYIQVFRQRYGLRMCIYVNILRIFLPPVIVYGPFLVILVVIADRHIYILRVTIYQ